MANKKIFSIQINGLDESVRSVDALTEKIQNLQKLINSMKGKGVEIPLEVGGENVVKELKAISNKVKSVTKGALPLDAEKEYLNLLRQRQKALEAVNKEMGDTGKNAAEFKQETKDLVAQETKARNEAKQYTNTLAGLKAELKDLKASIQNVDFNSEVYKETADKIYVITQRLKELEAEQNTFGRNVGNYRDAAEYLNDLQKESKEAKEEAEQLRKKWDELYKKIDEGKNLTVQEDIDGKFTLNQLNAELSSLKTTMNNTMGTKDYENVQKYYDALKIVSDRFKRLRGEAVKADNQLKTQLQRTINDQEYTWENLTAAVGELEDKLYQMAANGQKNTVEFQNIAKAAAELKTQLRQVDYEIDSMTESSKGIAKMVSYAQGFTAIAQGAQGLSQLFGMDNEDSLKGIQTLQSLQSIAMSLQTIKELSKQGTAFGKMLQKWIDRLTALSVTTSQWFKKWDLGVEDMLQTRKDIAQYFEGIAKDAELVGKEIVLKPSTDIVDLIDYGKALGLGKEGTMEFATQAGYLVQALREQGNTMVTVNEVLGIMGNNLKRYGGYIKDAATSIKLFKKTSEETPQQVKEITFRVGEMDQALNGMTRGARLLIKGIKGVNIALKGLKAILATTGIFLLVEAVMTLIGWLADVVKGVYQWAVGNDKLVDSMTTLEGRLNSVNAQLERTIKLIENANRVGRLSDLGNATAQYVEYSKAVQETAKQLKEFIKLRGDAKKLEENFSDDGLTQTWDFKSIEQFRSEYEKLLKAVESGTDAKGKKSGEWYQVGKWDIWNWFTAKDAKSDLGVMQKRVIEDIQNRINNLDLSKGTQELEEFFKVLDDEMYTTSLENIENLFPEEEWAAVLKKRLESLRNFFEQSKEASAQLDEVVKAKTKAIRDNETEAIKASQERELKALRNAMADEIEAAKNDQEIIASIRLKYQRLEEEMLDKHHKEILAKERDLQRQIRDNYLSAEDESLIKRIQEINNERYDAIEDARLAQAEAEKQGLNMTEQYNQLILSINKKYDAEIIRAKQDYYNTLRDELDKYAQDVIKAEEDIARDRLDKAGQDAEIKYNVTVTSGQSINYKAQLSEIIEQEKANNKYRLEVELQYLKEKKALDDQYASLDRDSSSEQEEHRYKKALESLEEFKRQGNATEEEYNKLVEQEAELHQKNLQRIQEQYNSTMEVNEKNHQNDMKNIIGQYLQQDIDLYQKYMDKANEIVSEVGREVNIFKIMKFSDGNDKFKEALDNIKKGLEDVEKERKNIDSKLRKNEITIVDANAAREQLEETEKELKRGAKDISLMQKDFFGEVAGQWKQMIDQWVGAISGLLQTLNDTQMQIIENQLAEVEHQLEIQELAYEKAEEAAEEHKNKMDDIEDELSEARGSRRQFLIDTYAAQQAAYLEDLAAQQRAAEEKEKLEKKQQALEKKRKQQEKKANVQQALINTFTAVSNALAVQPWFVGLALSAVALGMGMANVAAIKNTPIYEDGGVISGPRHSQGGVKVLGGTAEVEGGEYITNRKSTAANLPLLTYINDQKRELTAEDLMKFFASGTPKFHSRSTRMFADGGQLPTTNTEVNRVIQVNDASNDNVTYVVQVTDIINATDNLRKVQTLSGLYNE